MQFKNIPGNQKIKEKLIKSVEEERIAHAQLFIGTEGSAGLPLAFAYAQFVNCLDASKDDSCGKCSSCIKYEQLVHPDLHLSFPVKGAQALSEDYMAEFRKEFLANPFLNVSDWMSALGNENSKPNITAMECRNLINKLGLKPYESKVKVLVVWMPEYLGKEGNILLKLIEEPLGNALIIMVGESEDRLLGTILSRTQLTRIPLFNSAEIGTYLTQHKGVDEQTAQQVALLSNGNMNKAISLLNHAENKYFDQFRAWMLDCYKGNGSRIDHWVKELSALGREPIKSFIDYGLQICRACVVEPYGLNNGRLTENESIFVQKLSNLFDTNSLESFYRLLSESRYAIERNGNAKIVIFNLSLDIHKCLTLETIA
ncbi:hypothetical protein OAB01_02785 [Bacteroidia bacterium]|nr:hypothetical protein [Bacteroidia bacterium]